MEKRKVSDEEEGLFLKLKTNIVCRRKFVLTLSVFWSYVILGWSVLQIGTALPDIQRLVRVDLETASWIFTVYSIGFVFGSLVSGRLYDHHNRLVIMLINSVLLSVSSFCVPYCRSVAILLVIRLFSGFFASSIDTGANTIVPTIWDSKEGQSFMQAMYLTYTLGGIFSPLATKPFMSRTYDLDFYGQKDHAKTLSTEDIDILTSSKLEDQLNSTSQRLNVVSDYPAYRHLRPFSTGTSNLSVNFSSEQHYMDSVITDTTQIPLNNSSLNGVFIHPNETFVMEDQTSDETKIHFAFIMTGVIIFSSALPYLIMSIIGNYDQRITKKETGTSSETDKLQYNENDLEKQPKANKVSQSSKVVLLALVAGINFTYSAIEDSLGAFMTTYCLFYLHWTKSDAVLLMSMYWVASCLGGFLAIFVIKLLGPAKLLCLAFTVWNTSFIVAVMGNITKYAILTWIGFLGAGSAMVLIIPAIISWTNDNVCEITGKVSSIFMISTGVGIAANPKFIGYMMEEFSYGNLVYILTGETLVCTALFYGALIIYKCCARKRDLFRTTKDAYSTA